MVRWVEKRPFLEIGQAACGRRIDGDCEARQILECLEISDPGMASQNAPADMEKTPDQVCA
jgi:hypothetical protein